MCSTFRGIAHNGGEKNRVSPVNGKKNKANGKITEKKEMSKARQAEKKCLRKKKVCDGGRSEGTTFERGSKRKKIIRRGARQPSLRKTS